MDVRAKRKVSARAERGPQNHRTIDRVTRILEEVVYKPGVTFAELARSLGAAKSSVHGFIRGLLAKGWLYEAERGFYLGPAVYGLTLASGQIRAGSVTHDDLVALHDETGVSVFLGVQAGDHLIYIAEAGTDAVEEFDAKSNIRRTMLATAGGKALLTARSDSERDAYLRRRSAEESDLVDTYLNEYKAIKKSGIAINLRRRGARFAIATVLHNSAGVAVASVTLVGATTAMKPRVKKLSALLLRRVGAWSERSVTSRVAI